MGTDTEHMSQIFSLQGTNYILTVYGNMLVYFGSTFINRTQFLCPTDPVIKNKWSAFVNCVHFLGDRNWGITL